jgi:hypothetical protein
MRRQPIGHLAECRLNRPLILRDSYILLQLRQNEIPLVLSSDEDR